jgi:hypothetical protein
MWAILRHTSHRGGWRSPHTYRTPSERASDVLWWAVVATTLAAAISYGIYLFQ